MDKNKVIEAATKLIAKGALDKAVKEYQRILEAEPDDVRVLQKLAELYQKMGRKSDAADCFEKVARTYSAQGFYLKAVALYKQVLKVIDRIEVNVRLAELYQQLGLIGDATKEWQTVAAHYEKAGDTKQSLDTLKKLVDLDPDNVAARIRLGEQYAKQEQPVEAAAELRRAAQHLQRNGRQDDYLKVAERISHLDQNDLALAKELAEHYLGRGDAKRALAKLQVCFKANPKDIGTLRMLGRAFQELGQISKTVSVLKELGRVHADAGNAAEARQTYVYAIELAPDDAELKASLQGLEQGGAPKAAPAPAKSAPPPRSAPAVIAPSRAAPAPVAAKSAPMPLESPAPPASRKPPAPAPQARQAAVDVPPPGAVPKLLKETEVYVKYGLHEKALEHLRRIFAADPDNVEAHEKAKAVARATKRTEDEVSSLATLVRLYGESGDAQKLSAARAELAELEPGHPALAGGAPAKAAARPAVKAPPARPAKVEAAPEFIDVPDDDAGIGTGIGTEEELVPLEEPAGDELGDEPLGDEALGDEALGDEPLGDEALVDEPLDEPVLAESLDDEPLLQAAHDEGPVVLDDEPLDAPLEPEESPVELVPLESAPAAEEGDAVAGDLAEADFYIQAGMFDNARAILDGVLLAAPDHPGVAERLARMEPPAEEPGTGHGGEDLAADLAAELAEEEGLDENKPLDADVLDPFQVPADEVLGEFRAKVQQVVRPEDVQTHYDLGIAYKEMGLLDEAIGEFELAYEHGGEARAADCLIMLGTCQLEKGDGAGAAGRFQEALGLPTLSDEARKALRFELGAAYEAQGLSGEAAAEYAAVQAEDPGFRDVQARVARLGGVRPAKAPARAAARPAAAAQKPQAEPESEAARKNRKIGFI